MVIGAARPHHAPPFYSGRTTTARPHPHRGEWGLAVLKPVESVGPGEAVQQGARVGDLLAIFDVAEREGQHGLRHEGG